MAYLRSRMLHRESFKKIMLVGISSKVCKALEQTPHFENKPLGEPLISTEIHTTANPILPFFNKSHTSQHVLKKPPIHHHTMSLLKIEFAHHHRVMPFISGVCTFMSNDHTIQKILRPSTKAPWLSKMIWGKTFWSWFGSTLAKSMYKLPIRLIGWKSLSEMPPYLESTQWKKHPQPVHSHETPWRIVKPSFKEVLIFLEENY